MSEQRIITASLEGMRVVVDGRRCELHEYHFLDNRWLPKDQAPWPLTRDRAQEWLAGWNDLDRFTAIGLLTAPAADPERRAARPDWARGAPGLDA